MRVRITMSVNLNRFSAAMAACSVAAVAALTVSHANAAGPRQVADTFTATTVNMTPADLGVRVQILEWQEQAARTEAVATIAAGAEAATPLAKLPTVGYIWPNGSPVGYSVKYAHRVQNPDGEEITLVTDKRLGSYDFKGWSVAPPAVANDLPYSVIEIQMNGSTGTGKISLAGDVHIDEAAGTVALQDNAPTLLGNVKRETSHP